MANSQKTYIVAKSEAKVFVTFPRHEEPMEAHKELVRLHESGLADYQIYEVTSTVRPVTLVFVPGLTAPKEKKNGQ